MFSMIWTSWYIYIVSVNVKLSRSSQARLGNGRFEGLAGWTQSDSDQDNNKLDVSLCLCVSPGVENIYLRLIPGGHSTDIVREENRVIL